MRTVAKWLVLGALTMPGVQAAALDFYVATNGSDAWSGRRAAPNAQRTDGPFATIERAQQAVRAARGSGSGAITVQLRAGVYALARGLKFGEADSGQDSAPVVYRAYRNEAVVLRGGKAVGGWAPVSDAAALARLPREAHAHVLVSDLRAQGITDFGQMRRRGFGIASVPAGLELFFGAKPMPLAGWPNEGWAKVAGAPAGQEGGKFSYEGDRPSRWTAAPDVWVHGYWTWDWADSYEHVEAIDTASRTIATRPPHGVYGYTAGKRWRAINLLEELDSPGEWYLDRQTGKLYFWPPAPIASNETVVSLLEEPLISTSRTSHLRFERFVLEAGRQNAIEIRGGSDVEVAGCVVRAMGGSGITIDGGRRNGVRSCDLYDLGESGIWLIGGDRKTLEPCENYAINNHITRMSRWCRTYRPAIGISGVGVRAAHNLIHDGPHNAILFGGNDHLIELNDIARVCTQTGDAGAIYSGRNLTMRGTIIRHNRFTDIGRVIKEATSFVDVMSVYLDDCYCGTLVEGNLFVRAGRAAMIGGGRDNAIVNNVFVECKPSIHVDARGTGWASFWFDGRDPFLMDGLKEVPYNRAPYTKYPNLANILEDEPAKAKYNRIERNVRMGGTWIEWLDGMSEQTVLVRDNWLEGDPGFVAPEKGDFRLKKTSPLRRLGFKEIPVARIGLQPDRYRTAAAIARVKE